MSTPVPLRVTLQTCPECHGRGRIRGRDCPFCAGKGYTVHHKSPAVPVPAPERPLRRAFTAQPSQGSGNELQREWRANNWCIDCGSRDVGRGRVRCVACLEKRRHGL